MRIGQLIQTVGVQGGGTSTAFLATLAAIRTRPDLEVRAIALRPPAGDPAWQVINARPDHWTLADAEGRNLRPGELGARAAQLVRSRAIDLLHIHGLWSPDLLAAARAASAAGIPCIWEVHGMLVREAFAQKRWKKELFLAAGLRRALRSAAAVLFVTDHERDDSILPSGIGPERCAVVPLAVELPVKPITPEYRREARARFGVPPDAPCVVFMGRFHHVKRIELTLAAVARLDGDLADTRLLIIGGGDATYTNELKALAQRLNLGERINFAGWVQGEDKWRALAAADALALNSLHENFGYVAVEALCTGTRPVLTTNLALAETLGAAGLAETAAPDEASLAAALSRALRRQDQAELLASGPRWVDEHLSPGAVGALLGALYHRAAFPTASMPETPAP